MWQPAAGYGGRDSPSLAADAEGLATAQGTRPAHSGRRPGARAGPEEAGPAARALGWAMRGALGQVLGRVARPGVSSPGPHQKPVMSRRFHRWRLTPHLMWRSTELSCQKSLSLMTEGNAARLVQILVAVAKIHTFIWSGTLLAANFELPTDFHAPPMGELDLKGTGRLLIFRFTGGRSGNSRTIKANTSRAPQQLPKLAA